MYTKLEKKARVLMMLTSLIECLAILGVIVTIGVFTGDFSFKILILAACTILCLVIFIIKPFVRYERYRYRFTD